MSEKGKTWSGNPEKETTELEELKKIRSRLEWILFIVGIPLWILGFVLFIFFLNAILSPIVLG